MTLGDVRMPLKHLRWLGMGLCLAQSVTVAAATSTKSLPLATACDLVQSTLGAGFVGHNSDEVYATVAKAKIVKDDYETKAAFEARQSAWLSAHLPTAATGHLCFVADRRFTDPSYDPEAKTLWVPLLGTFRNLSAGGGRPWHYEFRRFVSERGRRESTYSGANAFGVSKPIHRTDRQVTYLAFDADKTTAAIGAAGGEVKDAHLSFPVKLEPEQARALKGKVAMAVEYGLVAPYVGRADEWTTPTLNMPYDLRDDQALVFSSIRRVAIYRTDTGEVIARFEL